MLKNYKNTIRIRQFRAIHGAMIRPNINFFHDGLLTPAVTIFCSPRLRTLHLALTFCAFLPTAKATIARRPNKLSVRTNYGCTVHVTCTIWATSFSITAGITTHQPLLIYENLLFNLGVVSSLYVHDFLPVAVIAKNFLKTGILYEGMRVVFPMFDLTVISLLIKLYFHRK